MWLPYFHVDVLKRKVGKGLTNLAHLVLDKMHTEHGKEEEEEETRKNLKDLRFETCSRAELEEFFRDKSFKKEVAGMLRIYLELRCRT